jgi:iron-sulfur cluster assembly protein
MKQDIVNITERAKAYITERCDGGQYLISVSVNNKGCSGHSYEWDLVDPTTLNKFDEKITWVGGGLSISAQSVMHLIGSTLDLKESAFERYLVWDNPLAVNHCGCGTSFSLKT